MTDGTQYFCIRTAVKIMKLNILALHLRYIEMDQFLEL